MAFRAVHAEWGTVFAHPPDLGCGHRAGSGGRPAGRPFTRCPRTGTYGQPAPGRDSRSVTRSNSSVSGSPTSWPNSVSP